MRLLKYILTGIVLAVVLGYLTLITIKIVPKDKEFIGMCTALSSTCLGIAMGIHYNRKNHEALTHS